MSQEQVLSVEIFFGAAILSQLPIHSHNMGQAAEPAATLLQNQNN